MQDRRLSKRGKTLLAGKIILNGRRSVIDCVIRNLSDDGACLAVNTSATIPADFELAIDDNAASMPCHVIWRSDTRIGIRFSEAVVADAAPETQTSEDNSVGHSGTKNDLVRSEVLAVRAALEEAPIGVVLLDRETRVQFINRAFRKMWRLPDEIAEKRPPFVALMYHGRDTHAYAVSDDKLDAYIAERVAWVKEGYASPLDLRLANGEIIRLQCAVLPSGGRMLFYSYVTDIVRHSDELEMLRSALDQTEQGVILLDEFLNVQYLNRSIRRLWKISDEQASRNPSYVELVTDARKTGTYQVDPQDLNKYIAGRVAVIRAGDPTPVDIQHSEGRVIRAQCAVLPRGGRMITYNDVTDLVKRANELEKLASLDAMTGIWNRRYFDALAQGEWDRFQRYQRPLSLILLDIDCFKLVNDRFGHEAGDKAIKRVATLCKEGKRSSDIVARIGGDEFAVLLPETDLASAKIVAERIRQSILQDSKTNGDLPTTISLGLAAAAVRMSGIPALMTLADKALYEAKAAGRNCVRTIGEPVSVLQAAAE